MDKCFACREGLGDIRVCFNCYNGMVCKWASVNDSAKYELMEVKSELFEIKKLINQLAEAINKTLPKTKQVNPIDWRTLE